MDIIRIGNGVSPVSYLPVGIGGAGSHMVAGRDNAVSVLIEQSSFSPSARRLWIPPSLIPAMEYASEGLYAKDSLASVDRWIREVMQADVFLGFSGLGGRISGALAPYLLDAARAEGMLSVFSATLPFSVEARERVEMAGRTLSLIEKKADLTVVYSNDALSRIARDMPITRSFQLLNSILWIPLDDLKLVLTKEDIPDLRSLLRGKTGFFGMGRGHGRDKEKRAVMEALRSPWLEHTERSGMAIAVLHGRSPSAYSLQDVGDALEERTNIGTLLGATVSNLSMHEDEAKLSLLLLK